MMFSDKDLYMANDIAEKLKNLPIVMLRELLEIHPYYVNHCQFTHGQLQARNQFVEYVRVYRSNHIGKLKRLVLEISLTLRNDSHRKCMFCGTGLENKKFLELGVVTH